MKRTLILLTLGFASVCTYEVVTTFQLERDVTIERSRAVQASELRRKQQELRQHALDDHALAELRKQTLPMPRRTEASPSIAALEVRPAMALSEWRSASSWANRGQGSPEAALETALFAAAGGDVALFSGVLELGDDARDKVRVVLQALPSAHRSLYPTPESFVSALAIKRIPVGDAQLVWSQPLAADTAVGCIFLRNPPTGPGAADFIPTSTGPGRVDNPPPQLSPDFSIKPVVLTFHRTGDQWKLVVPREAVDGMITQLAEPKS